MYTLDEIRMFAKYHLKRRVVDYPARETELGITLLDFDIDRYSEQIRSYGDRFELTILEEVSYQERRFEMFSLSSARDGRRARKSLLVLAGVHGNEHAGLLAVPDILDGYLAREDRSVGLTVVTPCNPVGAAELSRYNAEGYDINRDFVRFDTPEARAVARVFEDAAPDFIVALHEGPQDATFMFTNRFVADSLAHQLLVRLEEGGTTLADRDYFKRTLEPRGYAPTSRTMWFINELWARTLGMMATNMWADRRGVPEITLESSWRGTDRDARIRPHADLVAGILDAL